MAGESPDTTERERVRQRASSAAEAEGQSSGKTSEGGRTVPRQDGVSGDSGDGGDGIGQATAVLRLPDQPDQPEQRQAPEDPGASQAPEAPEENTSPAPAATAPRGEDSKGSEGSKNRENREERERAGESGKPAAVPAQQTGKAPAEPAGDAAAGGSGGAAEGGSGDASPGAGDRTDRNGSASGSDGEDVSENRPSGGAGADGGERGRTGASGGPGTSPGSSSHTSSPKSDEDSGMAGGKSAGSTDPRPGAPGEKTGEKSRAVAEAKSDKPTKDLRPAEATRALSGAAVDQATTTLRAPAQDSAPPAPPRPSSPPADSPSGDSATAMLRTPPKPAVPPPPSPEEEADPLQLLARLTNKPAPPETPLRTAVRRIKIWSPLVVLLLVVLAVVQLFRPLPDPSLELTAAETHTFAGEAPQVPWPDAGQAVLDVDGVGTFGSSGEMEPVPIASVAKVMTAYVILNEHPMEPGAEGEIIPIDQQAEEEGQVDDGQSIVEVHAGDELSQRELLQAIMIASANNVARLLARWDAGSEEAFVEKMNQTAEELGMENTTYTDPSGLEESTVSTAADQVILGRAVMEIPVFRELVGVSSYTDSYGTVHTNYNYLVPVDGVIGIKPGTTSAAGGNLLFAAEQEVAGTTQLIVGAVLAQPPHPSDNSILTGALTAGDQLIDFAQDALLSENIFEAGDVVGEVDNGLGGSTPVVVTEDVPAVGWSGLQVRLELTEAEDGVPGSAEAGTVVGHLVVGEPGSGTGGTTVPVALGEDMSEPGIGDKLLRLG